jgi:hypothetical protein
MSEQVIRHRGGGRDENGQLITATDVALTPIAIAPGGGQEIVERERNIETIACTVYFTLGTDVVNSDLLTVRGERFNVVVNEWRSPWAGSVGGLEVLCTRGQG